MKKSHQVTAFLFIILSLMKEVHSSKNSIQSPTSCSTIKNPSESVTSMRYAIITGGTRGIGRGISEVLAASNEYDGLLLTYNTNNEVAENFRQSILEKGVVKKVEIVGGDLTTIDARNKIFACADENFSDYDLATVVHNAMVST
mmetsp:Transcript_15431/g.17940  ORF Transcript_15431/g.17940 Transcript_15431/m.17940 type:complete len:144 (+) Transcript_15431:61-492(+)